MARKLEAKDYSDYVHLGWDGKVEIVNDLSMTAFLAWLDVEGIAAEDARRTHGK